MAGTIPMFSGDLPCVPLKIGNLILVALVDTGAEKSFINGDTFQNVCEALEHDIDFDPTFGSAGSRGGEIRSRVFGSIKLSGVITGEAFEASYMVLIDEVSVDYDIIIGVDTLKALKAIFDFGGWALSSPLFDHTIKFLTPKERADHLKKLPQ